LAPDPAKDQSYFCVRPTQEKLQRVLFPNGASAVRSGALAEEYESQTGIDPISQGLRLWEKVSSKSSWEPIPANGLRDHRCSEITLWRLVPQQRKGALRYWTCWRTPRSRWYVVAKDPDNETGFVPTCMSVRHVYCGPFKSYRRKYLVDLQVHHQRR
jgi:tRNA U34 2-thiouridine synthase MnmA/TrmU